MREGETAVLETEPGRVAARRRERNVAWVATCIAVAYFAWLGTRLWRSNGTFVAMYFSMGTELPVLTRLLSQHADWFYPTVFGCAGAAVVAKEVVIRDKRLSAIVTCALAVAVQFLAHWLTTMYYLPLFELVRKLS